MRFFFCHASEDKPVVQQVHQRVAQEFPDEAAWLDDYEIVAGQDLIEKISEGIREADKFFVFLSEQSIDKPWVNAELRAALMDDIEGVKPDFIVPVKLGPISKFPTFLRSKKYIDLEKKAEAEWLQDIAGVIKGAPIETAAAHQQNLDFGVEPVTNWPSGAVVVFQARYWAEDISFRVETAVPIAEREWYVLDASNNPVPLGTFHYSFIQNNPHIFAVQLPGRTIQGGERFAMLMNFAPGTNLNTVVTRIEKWDGSGAEDTGIAAWAHGA